MSKHKKKRVQICVVTQNNFKKKTRGKKKTQTKKKGKKMQEGEHHVSVNADFLWEGIARVGDKTARLSDEEKKSRERREKAREQREMRKKKNDLIRGASGGNLEAKRSESRPIDDMPKKELMDQPDFKEWSETKRPDDWVPKEKQTPIEPPPRSQSSIQLEQDVVLLRTQLENMQTRECTLETQLTQMQLQGELLQLDAEARIEAAQAKFESVLNEHITTSSAKMQNIMADMERAIQERDEDLRQMRQFEQEKQKLREADELAERQAQEAYQNEEFKEVPKEPEQKQEPENTPNQEKTQSKPKENWHESFDKSVKYAKLNAMKHGYVVLTTLARTTESVNSLLGQPFALDHFGDVVDKAIKDGEFNESIVGFVDDPFVMDILTKPSVGIAATFLQKLTAVHTENVKELNRDGVYGYRRDARLRDDATRNAAMGNTAPQTPQTQQAQQAPQQQAPQAHPHQATQRQTSQPTTKPNTTLPQNQTQLSTPAEKSCSSSSRPECLTSWGKRTHEKNQQQQMEMKKDKPQETKQKAEETDSDDDILHCDTANPHEADQVTSDSDAPCIYVRDPVTGEIRKSAVCRVANLMPDMVQAFTSEMPNGLVSTMDTLLQTITSKPLPKPPVPDFHAF